MGLRTFDASAGRLQEASRLTPAGVHSNIRADERPTPLFFSHGEGSHLFDLDGGCYIDYVLGQGPMLLGHNPAPVLEAVRAQLERGILFGGQHELEIEAAELVIGAVPCAERIRFNVTGSEAIQSALRLARAATGRTKVVKFAGHYHGWTDGVAVGLEDTGQALKTDGTLDLTPASDGMPATSLSEILLTRWNDADALETLLGIHGHDVAAVIMEPVMGNSGVVLPRSGYLEAARAICARFGIVLIFDEVITGFRLALGGAQERLGVVPDLAVFGKALGSGFPVACVAGRADLFAGVEDRSVLHAGTFNASPISLAAVTATIRTLAADSGRQYSHLETTGGALMRGLGEIMARQGGPFVVSGLPMFFSVLEAGPDGPRDRRPATMRQSRRVRELVSFLLRRGVRIQPRGNMFLSTAHTDVDVAETIAVFEEALDAYGHGAPI